MPQVHTCRFTFRLLSNLTFPSQLCPSLPPSFQAHLFTIDCQGDSLQLHFIRPTHCPLPSLQFIWGKIQCLLKISFESFCLCKSFLLLCPLTSLVSDHFHFVLHHCVGVVGGSLMVSPGEQGPCLHVFLYSTAQFLPTEGLS